MSVLVLRTEGKILKTRLFQSLFFCCIFGICIVVLAQAQEQSKRSPFVAEMETRTSSGNIHKILDNGPDAGRKVILVVGEGYAKADAAKYAADVDRIVLQGVLGHDVFKELRSGFNVYRADVWSNSSGVSQSGGLKKNTAFDITFSNNDRESGYFGRWYLNKKTTQKIEEVEASIPMCDCFLVILNDKGHGGQTVCNHWIMLSAGSSWQTLLHEMGHAIGHLFDEYEVYEKYEGPPVNEQNATSYPDRITVPWASMLLPGTKVPTPENVTPKNGVGVYEGGATFKKGSYRPSLKCRMRSSHEDDFCPYCRQLLSFLVNQYLPKPKPYPGDEYKDKKMPSNLVSFGFTLTKSGLVGKDGDSKGISPFTDFSQLRGRSFVAEAYNKSGTVKATLTGNPFEVRSFPRKGEINEARKQLDEGRVFMNLPFKSKAEAIRSGIGLRLYGIDDRPAVERANANASEGDPLFPGASKQNEGNRVCRKAIPTELDGAQIKELRDSSQLRLLGDFTASQ